ncbi:MAG: response regulator [Planctomycetota bacterium]|jgi:two-component system response regulator|nr:response regulator [Planctomycetota bacterium]
MSRTVPGRPVDVLMVEDSPTDAELAELAIQDAKVQIAMDIVEDGFQAMAYLRNEGNYADRPTPNLVILDLNLPGKDGREVLEEIRSDENLTHLPVVILTTSEDERDIYEAYKQHVNAFITKPVDFDQLVKVIKQIEEFWFGLAKLPRK